MKKAHNFHQKTERNRAKTVCLTGESPLEDQQRMQLLRKKMGIDKVKSKTQDLIGEWMIFFPTQFFDIYFAYLLPCFFLCSLTLFLEEDDFFPLVLSARFCFNVN